MNVKERRGKIRLLYLDRFLCVAEMYSHTRFCCFHETVIIMIAITLSPE